jgi:hypothetical protein
MCPKRELLPVLQIKLIQQLHAQNWQHQYYYQSTTTGIPPSFGWTFANYIIFRISFHRSIFTTVDLSPSPNFWRLFSEIKLDKMALNIKTWVDKGRER